MLMFQNGLFASFIPEILMVLAYLVCLLTPGVKSHESNVDQTQLVAQVSNYVPQQISSTKIYTADFHAPIEIISFTQNSHLPIVRKDTYLSYNSPFSTSDGLSYVDFSRPPPAFVS
jgi:hypothetical protein